MQFEQLDFPTGDISMVFNEKQFQVIGVQVLSESDNSGSRTTLFLIDRYGKIDTSPCAISGDSFSMAAMIEGIRSQMPNVQIYDTGRYCVVSQLGEKMVITLTKEGRESLSDDGVLTYMFDDMDNGTKLSLNVDDIHPNIIGPYVSLTRSASKLEKGISDKRVWHYPECQINGKRQFWRQLSKQGFIILELAKPI